MDQALMENETDEFVDNETDEVLDPETDALVEKMMAERAVFDRWERSHSRLARMVWGKTPPCLIVTEVFLLMKRTVECWPESREVFQERLPQFQEFLATFQAETEQMGQLPDANPLPRLDIGPVGHHWRGIEEKSLAVFGG